MYLLTASVTENLITAVSQYRQRYDPWARLVEPHISVLGPFQYSGEIKDLYGHIQRVSEGIPPIKVSLAGWDIQQQGADYKIRLPIISGRQSFVSLHKELHSGPLSHLAPADPTYWPEVIFGRLSTQMDIGAVKMALKTFEPRFVFRVEFLDLRVQEKPLTPWREVTSFALDGTLTSQS